MSLHGLTSAGVALARVAHIQPVHQEHGPEGSPLIYLLVYCSQNVFLYLSHLQVATYADRIERNSIKSHS